MAEEFDPAWEYFQGDPEVEELLTEQAELSLDHSRLFNPLFDNRIHGNGAYHDRRFSPGYQVYSGRHPRTFLGRERVTVVRVSQCRTIECSWCGVEFTESRPFSGVVCSRFCSLARTARKRRLRADSGVCACGKVFAPSRVGQSYCSRQCGGRVTMKIEFADGCPACGVELPKFKNGKTKAYCSRRCKHVIQNRKYHRVQRVSDNEQDEREAGAKSTVTRSGVVVAGPGRG